MCVSVSPRVRVHFSDTILYAAEVCGRGKARDKMLHVLGYENTVQNALNGNGHQGNAMLLPLPAVPGTMTQANCIPTEQCPRILHDYAEALFPLRWSGNRGSTAPAGPVPKARVEVFESGVYTIALAQDATAIPDALMQVPPEKLPVLNPELFNAYSAWYPKWTFALCCFNNQHLARATPLLWWYEPLNPDYLFAPALDCHTGELPDLTAEVSVDHTLIAGSSIMEGGWRVDFSDRLSPGISRYLVRRIVGDWSGRDDEIPDRLRNGDFIFPLGVVRAGLFAYARVPPPAA